MHHSCPKTFRDENPERRNLREIVNSFYREASRFCESMGKSLRRTQEKRDFLFKMAVWNRTHFFVSSHPLFRLFSLLTNRYADDCDFRSLITFTRARKLLTPSFLAGCKVQYLVTFAKNRQVLSNRAYRSKTRASHHAGSVSFEKINSSSPLSRSLGKRTRGIISGLDRKWARIAD